MTTRVHEHPDYQWLVLYLRKHGSELRSRYRAHGVGIGWKITGGRKTAQLALRFYVACKRPLDQLGEDAIPEHISFMPEGAKEAVEVATDVIESPPAELE